MIYTGIIAGSKNPFRGLQGEISAAIAAGLSRFAVDQRAEDLRIQAIEDEVLPKVALPKSCLSGLIAVSSGITPRHLGEKMLGYCNAGTLFGSIISDEAVVGNWKWKLVDISGKNLTSDFSSFVPNGYQLGSIDHLVPLAEQKPVLAKYPSDYINRQRIHTGIPWSSMNHIIAPGLLVTERFQSRSQYSHRVTDVDFSVAPVLRCDWSGSDGHIGWSLRSHRIKVIKTRAGSAKMFLGENFNDGTYLLVVKRSA